MAKLAFMSVIFEYKANDLTQHTYRIECFDYYNKKIKYPQITYGLKHSGIITENEFWPKDWGNKCLIHKSSAFWPKRKTFYYYYNICNYNNIFNTYYYI
jgi:hypothetical protein